MSDPVNAAAPAILGESQGERYNIQQGRADVSSLPMRPEVSERVQRRVRLQRELERRKATRALDRLLNPGEPQRRDAWDRAAANQLAAQGWDVEYLARRFGLEPRQAVSP